MNKTVIRVKNALRLTTTKYRAQTFFAVAEYQPKTLYQVIFEKYNK
jgi:hypothetical protein